MMKKKFALLSLPLLGLCLSGCTFMSLLDYDINGDSSASSTINSNINSQSGISNNESNSINTTGGKLRYTYKDYTSNNLYDIDSIPSEGNINLLVVPIWFTDSSNYISSTKAVSIKNDLEKAFFSADENETGWYSVKQYYEEESHKKVTIGGEVTDWYHCNKSAKRITEDEIEETLTSAVATWKNTHNSDYIASFDSDSNGYLDGVVLIYGYPNSSNSRYRSNDNLWAWTYWLQGENSNKANPVPNTYSFMSYDFMYESSSIQINIDAHTYIHEVGHMFGLEDYYDYNDTKGYESAGMFSMQDYNVGGHDPYSLLALGWANPIIPSQSGNVVLTPFTESGDVILLSPHPGSVFDEYILLEMYTPTGVNYHDTLYPYQGIQGPNEPGIRIWHVDARLISPNDANGKTYSESKITTEISNNTYGYLHLCTNTTYSYDYSSYCSPLDSCRSFRLLELIRCGDYSGNQKNSELDNKHLFSSNDEFNISSYSSYFVNNRFNDGTSFNWNVKINGVSNNASSITITIK